LFSTKREVILKYTKREVFVFLLTKRLND